MPGRVILKFPPPKTTSESGKILIPETSQMRPEFGQIHSIGVPLDDKQADIVEVLEDLREAGIPLCVSYGAGVSYWKQNYDPKEWGWLRDYRAYSIEEPAAMLVEDAKT